jgi:hypothetical protein
MISEHSTSTIPHFPFGSLTAWEQNLRDLTAQAGEAAELGRWDLVEECYRLRGDQLQGHPISPALATALMESDRTVETKIMNARSVVQSQLIETAKVRQNLLGLRSWQGLRGIEPTFMDRQA